MSKFGDSIKNALQSDTGQAASSAAIGAYSGWLNPGDDDGGSGSGGSDSITDQPWFLPVAVGGALLVLFLVTRSR